MWDMQVSCWNTEQIQNRPDVQDRLISSIPKIFYQGVEGNILDKCRSWTMPANLELIDKYITKSPKIVVMLRPIIDIVRSFVYIRQSNNWSDPEQGLFDAGSDPIMRSLDGVKHSKFVDNGQFLYVWYDDLVNSPKATIDRIYDFCGWDNFEHTYDNIKNLKPERDDLLNMIGLHDIRPNLARRSIDITLSEYTYDKALELDTELNALNLR